MANVYALILAGGSGTRFWPLSRDAKPKQLLNLFGDNTLLGETIDRLTGLIPLENILILTNQIQVEGVRIAAPTLPAENIIAEPAKRDTAPAVALGIGVIAARDPLATMIVLPADQLINDVASFQSVLRDAVTAAQKSASLVTIGIKPTWPCPSFGYIERGAPFTELNTELTHPPYSVQCFREKPSPELAEQFLRKGNFAWNAGMFIWSLPTVISELRSHTPELADFIDTLSQSTDLTLSIAENFPSLTPISIDYALMEKAKCVLNIEASFDWDDVGSWISVSKYLHLADNNSRSNSPLVGVDSKNNIVFTQNKSTQVALLGVNDIIVVQTDDAILIANRHQADDIKKLVELLPDSLR